MNALILAMLVCAAWPAILFLRNLRAFPPLPRQSEAAAFEVAILIPARNEERNIRIAIEDALANSGAEVLVLDDGSTDRTAEIVDAMAARQPRLHLLRGQPLPSGWCGKNWACAQLAQATDRPLLLFLDADVRLAPEAAASMAAWLRESGAQLASGVPRQEFGSFSERLLIPLIHFVLLGFLPLKRMRRSRHPAYATGCGQLVLADAAAYRASGGHASIRNRIHDGLALPRSFREAGFRTDLFDPTDLATCRMYRSNAETWRGLSKNTHEGLGTPARILPVTVILSLGQVLPFALLFGAPWLTSLQLAGTIAAALLAWLPRLVDAPRFCQPLGSAILQPLGIIALLAIQWTGLIRWLLRRPTRWKDRSYSGEISAADPARVG